MTDDACTPRWLILALLCLIGCAPTPASPTVSPSATPTGGEAMVVGTIHKGHLLQAGYPLSVLRRLVEAYHPDLVLVEVRPAAFAAGQYEDGPFEMTYVIDVAKRAGIPVEPIDWWREEDLAAEPTVDPANQRALDEALKKLEEPAWPSFEIANSPGERDRILRSLGVRARYEGGNRIWSRRQAWIHQLAIAAIEQRDARRVLAFVGTTHRPELEAHLQGAGIRVVEPLSLKLPPVAAEEDAPEPVVTRWRDGIGRLKAVAATLEGAARKRLDDKIRYFAIAVERKGRCCVTEAALQAP